MDSRQAREILALYRPGSTDAADPLMAEALDQAKRDPELAAWLEEHSAVYTAIRGKLKGAPVPPGLKRKIIVEQHGSRPRFTSLPGTAKILAAAAAVVLLSAIVWKVFNVPDEYVFPRYRDRMARSVQREGSYMDFVSTNQADIREFFRAKGAPPDFAISKNLEQLPGAGGSVKTWNNHPVQMLCLNAGMDATGKPNNLWVFIMDKTALPDAPLTGKVVFAQIDNLMTASWTTGGKLYLLAARGTEKDLQKYLE